MMNPHIHSQNTLPTLLILTGYISTDISMVDMEPVLAEHFLLLTCFHSSNVPSTPGDGKHLYKSLP